MGIGGWNMVGRFMREEEREGALCLGNEIGERCRGGRKCLSFI